MWLKLNNIATTNRYLKDILLSIIIVPTLSRKVPNARHHPRPNATYMRGTVMGRRVQAVVGRRDVWD
jgi:hypothetical protein